MIFAFLIAIVVMCALMVASVILHMRIRSGEVRPVVKYDQVHRAHVGRLHGVIFADETEDEKVALPA